MAHRAPFDAEHTLIAHAHVHAWLEEPASWPRKAYTTAQLPGQCIIAIIINIIIVIIINIIITSVDGIATAAAISSCVFVAFLGYRIHSFALVLPDPLKHICKRLYPRP